jgi:hypothetical protein
MKCARPPAKLQSSFVFSTIETIRSSDPRPVRSASTLYSSASRRPYRCAPDHGGRGVVAAQGQVLVVCAPGDLINPDVHQPCQSVWVDHVERDAFAHRPDGAPGDPGERNRFGVTTPCSGQASGRRRILSRRGPPLIWALLLLPDCVDDAPVLRRSTSRSAWRSATPWAPEDERRRRQPGMYGLTRGGEGARGGRRHQRRLSSTEFP